MITSQSKFFICREMFLINSFLVYKSFFSYTKISVYRFFVCKFFSYTNISGRRKCFCIQNVCENICVRPCNFSCTEFLSFGYMLYPFLQKNRLDGKLCCSTVCYMPLCVRNLRRVAFLLFLGIFYRLKK